MKSLNFSRFVRFFFSRFCEKTILRPGNSDIARRRFTVKDKRLFVSCHFIIRTRCWNSERKAVQDLTEIIHCSRLGQIQTGSLCFSILCSKAKQIMFMSKPNFFRWLTAEAF